MDDTITAAQGTATLKPGTTVPAMFCNGTLRCAPIRVTEGQTIRVRFVNGMSEETVIHWHGLGVPLGMDGVPDIARPGVALGQELVPVPGHDTGHLLLPPAPRGTA